MSVLENEANPVTGHKLADLLSWSIGQHQIKHRLIKHRTLTVVSWNSSGGNATSLVAKSLLCYASGLANQHVAVMSKSLVVR